MYGHPRAGFMIGHGKGATVAALLGAVPHQAARVLVGREPALEVVVVAMLLTLQLHGIMSLWAAGSDRGNPVSEPVRIRNQGPHCRRRSVDVA